MILNRVGRTQLDPPKNLPHGGKGFSCNGSVLAEEEDSAPGVRR